MVLILLLKVRTFRDVVLGLMLHLGHSHLVLLTDGFCRLEFGGRSLGRCFLLGHRLLVLLQFSPEALDLHGGSCKHNSSPFA